MEEILGLKFVLGMCAGNMIGHIILAKMGYRWPWGKSIGYALFIAAMCGCICCIVNILGLMR
jgi:hypothetical protein